MENHPPLEWPAAPAWGQFVGDLGRWFVFLAIAAFAVSALSWLLFHRRPWGPKVGATGLWVGTLSLLGVFGALGTLFVTDQFYFRYVFDHSDKATELWYKIAGIWSGQEGSFLLWAVSSALFGVLAARRTGDLRRWFTIPYALFLGGLSAILAYESPFRVETIDGKLLMPPDGFGMQPSLLNYWVTIHPPTIFLGFGSLTVLFCWALSALISGNLKDWIQPIRPWTIAAVTFLGVGLVMGGFWAYETLGWGGFWAWDPVENTSLVPWVFGLGFLHGIFVQVTRGKWYLANALLAGLPFLLFVYGTFLTRSGFLSEASVHSFAQMDRSALKLMIGIMGAGVVGFLGVWIWRAIGMRAQLAAASSAPYREDEPKSGFDREGFYAAGIWLLLGLGTATAVGMSIPFVMSLMQRPTKVVEEGLYHRVVVWFFVPLVIVMAIAPLLSWRRMGFRAMLGKVSNILAVTIGLLGLSLIWIKHPQYGVQMAADSKISFPFGMEVPTLPWIAFLVFICLLAITATFWKMAEYWPRAKSSIGGLVSHLGLVLMLVGLIVSRGFERDQMVRVQAGDAVPTLDRIVTFKKLTSDVFDRKNEAVFEVVGREGKFTATPGLYYKPQGDSAPMPVVWPHIQRNWTHDMYFAIGPVSVEASDIVSFRPGETKKLGNLDVKYLGIEQKGEAGTDGTEFAANLEVSAGGQGIRIAPAMKLTGGQPENVAAPVTDDMAVALTGMEAGDKSVQLQLQFRTPGFPVHLFYKPMTILVWIGAGIMTIGGVMATLYRRKALRPRSSRSAGSGAETRASDPEDAPVTPAQV